MRGLAPLRHRGFRRLVAGQAASGVGDACYAVALPWYVLATHGGALLLGTVLAAYGVPRTLAVVLGGQASDRWRPWTVMMASDSVRALAVGGLAAAAAAGPARAGVLSPIAVILGVGEGFFLPGSFAIIPALLPGDDLQAGNALSSAATQLATLAGPALGGALVALLGPAPAFAVDAATFVLSAASLAGVRAAQRGAPSPEPEPPPGPEPTVDPEQAAAPGPGLWGLLRSSRVLAVILLVTVAANLGSGGSDEVAFPALAHGPLHAGAGGYGGLIAAFAAGALLGTLAAGHLTRLRHPSLAGSGVFLAGAVFAALIPYAGGLIATGAAAALFGASNGMGNVIMITVFQKWAPPALLGRLTGLLVLASFGIFPVSVLLGAVVVRNLGPAPFFPMAAGALALAILAGLTQKEWRQLGSATTGERPAAAGITTGNAAEPAPGR